MPEEETKTEQTEPDYKPSPKDEKLIAKWKKRFKRAKDFRDPFQAKWLRMYQLTRAYQSKSNYAYKTRLMPPIAFEIVQTVISRLITAKRKTRILPREKSDADSDSIKSWDDLVNYDFDIIKLKKKLRRWLDSSVTYGNGIAMVPWRNDGDEDGDYDDPDLIIEDLWHLLPAPEATDWQDGLPWLIRRKVKTFEKIKKLKKAEAKKEEKDRVYKNLEYITGREDVEDWTKERYEINTKKMAQIAGSDTKEEGEETPDKIKGEKNVEIWEIWDWEEQQLITIFNKEVLVRDEENPYKNINKGKIFIDLPDHELNWELWAMGHIEPVETTILEIADLRNQRMDDVILNLDPVIKIKKNSGIKKNDIIFAPGAIWEMNRTDDVIVERPPVISGMGITEDTLMRKEIERTLALSEYMQGVPMGKQEPAKKVETLLGQGNLRLGLNAAAVSDALTQLANILIQLNQEFLTEDKLYRIVGDEVDFKEFKTADKEVKVDAIVEIEPVFPPNKQERMAEVLMLYDKLVAEDKPDPKNPKAVEQWLTRKRTLQEMMLEEMGREAFKEKLLGKEEEIKIEKKPVPEKTSVPAEGEEAPQPGRIRQMLAKIPLLKKL